MSFDTSISLFHEYWPIALDTSINLFNAYWPFACGVLVIFVVGIPLVRGVFLRKRLCKIEARLSDISAAMNKLQQIESRRFLEALKSGTIGEVVSKEDPDALSIVPEVAEMNSSTEPRKTARL